jgi:hypothetical protein
MSDMPWQVWPALGMLIVSIVFMVIGGTIWADNIRIMLADRRKAQPPAGAGDAQ